MRLFSFKTTLLITVFLFLASACNNDNPRKIRLTEGRQTVSDTNTSSSIVRLSAENQHAIAIIAFNNHTEEAVLDWLCRGLADMLQTELLQSPYLSVFSLTQPKSNTNPTVKSTAIRYTSHLKAAREAQAEILLAGRFYKEQGILIIDAEMIDVLSGQIIRRESVRGKDLSQIFSMVDQLSERVRTNIRGDLQELKESRNERIEMTHSVEAYRCYSEAIVNMEKFLLQESERCLKDALRHDSTFAAAHLQMAKLKLQLHSKEEAEHYLKNVHRFADRLSEIDKARLNLLEQYKRSNYAGYAEALENTVRRFPGNTELRIELAQYHANIGNTDRALAEFQAVLAQDPRQASVYNLLGYLFAKRGDFTTGLKYIEKYKEFRPDEPNPYDSKGEILMLAGRLKEAKTEFHTVMDRWPQFYFTAMRLAEVAIEEADHAEALRHSDYALAHAPSENVRLHNKMYRSLTDWRFGQTDKAQSQLNEILNDKPTAVKPLMLAVELSKSLGDSVVARELQETAFEHFTRRIKQDPSDLEFVRNLINFSLVSDLAPEKFIAPLEQVLPTIEDSDLLAFLELAYGMTLLRSGRFEDGKRVFAEKGNDFIDLITLKHNSGWGSGWKYVLEALELGAPHDPGYHPFIERVMQIAANTQRKELETMARLVRARLNNNAGNTEAVWTEFAEMGVPPENKWLLIGPFFPKGVSPFNHVFLPERLQETANTYSYGGQNYHWKAAAGQIADGYVDLRAQLAPATWAVGYAWTYVYAPQKRKVQIRLGTDETCKLWLNDELIWQHYLKTDAVLDRDIVTVVLRPGYNKLLLKVTNTDFDWGFYFRITDESGNGHPDLFYHSPDDIEQQLSHR